MADPSPPPMPRRAAVATAVVATVALLVGLLATTTLASRVGRIARFDDVIGAVRSASFELGAVGVQPLLGSDYVASVVGDAFAPAPDRERSEAAPPRSGTSVSSTSSSSSTTTTTERRTLVGRLLGDAELSARMVADRATVAPGEEITYTVMIRNEGTSTIRGNIEVQSHVPVGTLDARRECDSDIGINIDPDELCASTAIVFAPGTGDQSHQVVITTSGRLPPGEERTVSFAVRVADVVPTGTEITNHAHVDLFSDREPPVTTNEVVVVVS